MPMLHDMDMFMFLGDLSNRAAGVFFPVSCQRGWNKVLPPFVRIISRANAKCKIPNSIMKNLMVVLAFVAAFASSASAQENAEAENNAAPPKCNACFIPPKAIDFGSIAPRFAAAALEENTEVIPVGRMCALTAEEEKLSRGEEPLEINAASHSNGKTFSRD